MECSRRVCAGPDASFTTQRLPTVLVQDVLNRQSCWTVVCAEEGMDAEKQRAPVLGAEHGASASALHGPETAQYCTDARLDTRRDGYRLACKPHPQRARLAQLEKSNVQQCEVRHVQAPL